MDSQKETPRPSMSDSRNGVSPKAAVSNDRERLKSTWGSWGLGLDGGFLSARKFFLSELLD